MLADYPPPGTRVRFRWLSQGSGGTWRTMEGVVDGVTEVVIRADDGELYAPRPEWLEIVEEAGDD